MVVAFGRVVEWCALRGCGDGVFCSVLCSEGSVVIEGMERKV